MPAPSEALTVADLRTLYQAGKATITADEAYPVLGNVSRASFYRAMAAGEVKGVLRLGRKRLIALGPFLRWLGADEDDVEGLA